MCPSQFQFILISLNIPNGILKLSCKAMAIKRSLFQNIVNGYFSRRRFALRALRWVLLKHILISLIICMCIRNSVSRDSSMV